MGLLIFLPLFIAMYFLLIRPQQKRMREQQAMVQKLAVGDEVMLTAGIYGFVTELEDDTMLIEVAEGIEVRVARGAVARIIPATVDDETTDGAASEPDADEG